MLAELHPRLPTLIERAAGWVGRRPAIAGSVVGLTVLATAIVLGLARFTADVPLFDADLRPGQAAEVENALTLWGESFRSNAQGTQIFVAGQRKADLLFRLTLAGLPRRYMPTSTDVLDAQANALTPQSVIDDRRLSGIEGDIVAGLRRIAGVADATVVLPAVAHDPLADPSRDTPPTAAVQLVMEPGASLSTEAIAGIRRFVASAYPDLTPDRVTIVDASGELMGAAAPSDPAIGKERRVQSAVQSALDAVFGAGSSVVRVSVRTTGSEQQTQTTRVVPGSPLTADVTTEHGTEAGKNFDKQRTVRRYAYDTVSERRVTGADTQARISVAVFLDARRIAPSAPAQVESLVRAAAGADMKSGDEVVVEAIPFAPSPPPSSGAAGNGPAVQAVAPAAVACALALFGFASLPLGLRTTGERSRPPEVEPAPLEDPRAAAAARSLEHESPQTAAYVIGTLDAPLRASVLERCSAPRRAAICRFLDKAN